MGNVLRSVRGRSALGAAVVTALALAIASFALLRVLGNDLRSNLDATIETQAADRASLLDNGADPTSLVQTRQAESTVWIGTEDGASLAEGGDYRIVGIPPDLKVGGARTLTMQLEERYGPEIEFETSDLTVAVDMASNGTLVLVGAELETIDRTVHKVRRLLLGGLPLLVAIVGILGWLAADRALRPVEAIRSTAATTGSGRVAQRVPEPQTADEIQALAVTMNQMLDRIEGQQLAQQRFVADASHELKSPVANLRAVLDTSKIDDPKWPALQARLASESDRLAGIVDNLLFLAVYDEQGVVDLQRVVHVDDLLFDEAELLAQRSTLTVEISGVTPTDCFGTAEDLRRAVRNLVQNAERYAESRVALACLDDLDHVVITVSDDGPGIEPEHRESIFERFGRSDEARERSGGSVGLGLAIVSDIVRRHGGSVCVANGPHDGATFEIRLPSIAALADAAEDR